MKKKDGIQAISVWREFGRVLFRSGVTPVEMLGYVEFPTVTREPYRLTLGPYRSHGRRVGKECRSRWSPYHEKKRRHTSYISVAGVRPCALPIWSDSGGDAGLRGVPDRDTRAVSFDARSL